MFSLPFEGSIEDVIAEILKIKTVPTFSVYHPFQEGRYIDISKLRKVKITDNSYAGFEIIIPEYFFNRKLLYVSRIEHTEDEANPYGVSSPYYLDGFGNGVYHGGGTMYAMNRSVQLGQAADNLMSIITKKMTFKYIGPNRLRIFSAPTGVNMFYMTCAYEHDDNLETIADSCYTSFIELAELDIKSSLYASLRYYHQLNSAYGPIDLKIDEWQSAEGDRKSILDNWSERMHIDQWGENWS
jgi:hypothetical protein